MRLILFVFLFTAFVFQTVEAQQTIDVVESTLKISGLGDEYFYYGFCEGDQIVFNFEVVKGKNLKEVEIIALPSSSKFMDYKTKKIKNKTIQIDKTGIYKFKFSNSSISGRVCKFKIQRIPANESTKNFNTTVYRKTIRDTTYYMENERYLAAIDTLVIPIITHKVERVHSITATGKRNESTVIFSLPKNTVFWSYYLGVGKSSEAIFQQAEQKAKKQKGMFNTASTLVDNFATIDPTGSVALASIALKGWAEFGVNDRADNIQYWFTDYNNASLFLQDIQYSYFEGGNGPLSYKRMARPLVGDFYICMRNDNMIDGIDVHIRISAVTVKERWENRQVRKSKVNSWVELYLKN